MAWKRTVDEQQPDIDSVGKDHDAEDQAWPIGIVDTYYRMKNNGLLKPQTLEFAARQDERVPATEIPRHVWKRWRDDEPKDVQVGKALFVAERL